jgi:UDP-N-acetylmuramoylalanine--D-glutamate ligase
VAVIGLGTTGAAVVKALRWVGVRVYGTDSSEASRILAVAHDLEGMGATVECGRHDLKRIASSRAVVVSPGIPPSAPPVDAARNAGVEVWSEIDLASLSLGACSVVGVTGTNGKTTTTTVIDHLLRAGGISSVAAGNIGLPLIDVVMLPERPAWIVVELSSFQLHYSSRLRPTIGVLTNVQPDHMDWYDREEDYFADKKRLFLNAYPGASWIVNGDDHRAVDMADRVEGMVEHWSLERPADAWWDRSGDLLMFGKEEIVDRGRFPLLGDHNVANALAGALAARRAGLAASDISAGLRTMPQLEHRLETVSRTGGVRWINDSKGTNVASTTAALRSIEGNVILIAGGLDKGEDFARLEKLVLDRCSWVIVYGQAAAKLASQLNHAETVRVLTLADAVRAARAAAQPGDTVLLSPACASFDQFENYIHRGRTFRELVNQL